MNYPSKLLEDIRNGYAPAPHELAIFIDHTILKPDTTEKDIIKACEECKMYNFASLCIPPCYVSFAVNLLKNSKTNVITVIGFPNGYTLPEVKKTEALILKNAGAVELDMVVNIAMVKNKNFKYVMDEINLVKSIGTILKVIVETCYLDNEEKKELCNILLENNIEFIKTSTGFGPKGAEINDIKLFKSILGDKVKIKASGGIRNYNTALAMLRAGASRIGASASVKIVNGKL
jgi:deoxyribose-phosphate aldolase